MKRVQAMVTGRKKQCTKLPKPSIKEKKSPSESDVSSPGPARSLPDDNGVSKDGAGGSDKHAVSDPVPSASNTLGANSINASTTGTPTSRTATKIPATSPKKSVRDGGGWMLSRKNQRQEKQNVAKSETISKKPSKEKQKGGRVSESKSDAVTKEKTGSKIGQKMTSQDEAGYVAENRYTDSSLNADRVDQTVEASKPVSPPAVTEAPPAASPKTPQPNGLDETQRKDKRAEDVAGNAPRRHNDEHTKPQHVTQTPGQKTLPQPQSNQPLHGILKDSSSSIEHNNNANTTYHHGSQNLSNVSSSQTLEHPSSQSHRQPKTDSPHEDPRQLYQQIYGSLPRHPRTATQTAETAYSYGSFPRRTPGSTPSQQNVLYNGPQEWSSLARKAESDFVYPVSRLDRERSSERINSSGTSPNKMGYGVTGYNNDSYDVEGGGYHSQRSGTYSTDPRSTGYRVARNGMSAPQYNSDTEASRYPREFEGYSRGVRGGSVPLGYESDSGAYGVVTHGQPRFGSIPRSYETGPDRGGGGSGLRVHPGDEVYRAGPGKRPIPRRHTVGTSGNRIELKDMETDRKREAFMQLLAQRYPQYADRIQGAGSHTAPAPLIPDKPSRSREGQRRRTALVAYNPNMTTSSLEYDDIGTMNDLEVSSFQRGGFSRTSLPIVRSASTSLERPLGLVFLVYGDQTKKSLLPNEITTLDTVRALFVRAFPDLTLDTLENHRKKIYLLDPATNIYFQLEDLADIKDRSVLKIHETDNDQPQKVKERQEVRGRTVQMASARSNSVQAYSDAPLTHNDMMIKSQSLLPQHSHNYQELMQDQRSQWERDRRSRSRTPEPAERSQRSLSAGTSGRFSHSPDRLPTPPERLHLNSIPENRQIPLGHVQPGSYYENVAPAGYRGHYPPGIYESPAAYQGYNSAAVVPPQQTYVACSTRASPLTHPQRAVAIGHELNAGFQRSQSYRIPSTDRDGKDLSRSHSVTPVDGTARNRIEKMEQQLASLTAWVHYQKDNTRQEVIPAPRTLGRTASDSSDTFPASSASKHKGGTTPISTIATSTNHVVHSQGLSDINDSSSGQRSSGLSSRESTPLSAQAEISYRLAQLKSDLHVLRTQQLHNMEAMKDEFTATSAKIVKVLLSLPAAENQDSFHKRTQAAITKSSYISDRQQVDKDLRDLEATVEELRADVISKQCTVNTADVEAIACILNNATKSLADLKVRFIDIHGEMKNVLDAELNILVSEERFLKDEPSQIENSLKRCRHICDSLSYIKRIMSSQDQSLPTREQNLSRRDQSLPTRDQSLSTRDQSLPTRDQSLPTRDQSLSTRDQSLSTRDQSLTHVSGGTPSVHPLMSDKKRTMSDKDEVFKPNHEQRVNEAQAVFDRKEQVSYQQGAHKFDKGTEIAAKIITHSSANTGEKRELRKEINSGSSFQEKPAAPAKPIISSFAAQTHSSPATSAQTHSSPATSVQTHSSPATSAQTHSSPATSAQTHSSPATSAQTHSSPATSAQTHSSPATSAQTHSSPATSAPTAATTQVSSPATTSPTPPTPKASNVSFGKTSFSPASVSSKSSEKPTATVSAMTSGMPDAGTTNVIKAAARESSPPEMKNVFMPLTQTTERLINTSYAASDTGSISPKHGAESPKKKDATVYTYQVCGPVNPVFPVPPVPSTPENRGKTSPTETKGRVTSIYSEKTPLKSCSKDTNRPPDLGLSRGESVKKGSVSFSDPPVTNVSDRDHNSSLNGHSTEKVGHTALKYTARSAFFNSGNTSPSSPLSANRSSISLDHGPVLSPAGVVGKAEQGPTINLLLTGSVSPMSPTNPGSFNVPPPLEISLSQSAEKENKTTTNSSTQIIPHKDQDANPSDSQPLAISDSKQKKVPPPPPPRQSSRPASSTLPPLNGISPDLLPQQRDSPRFVGGYLGQHRLSEPLYTTPKPTVQPKPKNEQEISTLWQKSQKNSQKINEANAQNNANTGKESSTIDSEEHDSSSDSSTSSSGTVGSQHSIATVVRSSSVSAKDTGRPKPDPPKRHSSLLMKLTSGRESKSKLKNGKAKVNGVDF